MDCLCFCLLVLLSRSSLCGIAVRAFSLRSTFSGSQTISSVNGLFELGLFPMPNGSSKMYLGIWYKDMQPFTQVWVANREHPVSRAAQFGLSALGSFELVDENLTVWSRGGGEGSSVSSCELLPTGNLVLLTSNDSIAWQSFDEPADTWLPTMIFGRNKTLRSWKNPTDPSPGLYELQMDSSNTSFSSVYNFSKFYWSSGPWTGVTFENVPEMKSNFIYEFSFSPEWGFNWTVKPDVGSLFNISRFIMSPSGSIQQSSYNPSAHVWTTYWNKPLDPCQVIGLCGINGICNNAFSPSCNCLLSTAFKPVNKDEWEANPQFSLNGCERINPFNCSDGVSNDAFLPLNQTSFDMDTSISVPNVVSQLQCESLCLANCSCTAFYFANGGTKNYCSLFSEPLFNGKVNISTLGTFYARVSVRDMPSSYALNKKNLNVGIVVAMVISLLVGCVVLVAGVIIISVRVGCVYARRKRLLRRALGRWKRSSESGLIAFSYVELQATTNNFRDKLGSGGFGTVYQGMLEDGLAVAVKKLQRLDEGDKQFRAEVKTIGAIQHVNLVRLLGFCCEGKHRLLVYELAENGSLDGVLFNMDAEAVHLDWCHRFDVAIGVAKAVAYLHEACRECIIHCDIKPENILLDSRYTAKVTDFGLAKLIGREFSRALTTVRGTRGYLAPEWIAGFPITSKADVYSFGMTLLELISGHRNIQPVDPANTSDVNFFPVFAAQMIHKPGANLLSLVDPFIHGSVDMEELERMLFCAIWCIQDNEEQRPSMGKVVQVLEGSLALNLPPIPSSLQSLII